MWSPAVISGIRCIKKTAWERYQPGNGIRPFFMKPCMTTAGDARDCQGFSDTCGLRMTRTGFRVLLTTVNVVLPTSISLNQSVP